jgi:hypothetical protein
MDHGLPRLPGDLGTGVVPVLRPNSAPGAAPPASGGPRPPRCVRARRSGEDVGAPPQVPRGDLLRRLGRRGVGRSGAISSLVPVPRALTRRLKYGIDPARAIAIALGSRLHVPVLDVLVAPIHAPRRAGRDHSRRVRIFPTRSPLRSPVVIVDDVVTTGSTVSAATEAIGLELVGAVASANVVANVVRDGSNVRSA